MSRQTMDPTYADIQYGDSTIGYYHAVAEIVGRRVRYLQRTDRSHRLPELVGLPIGEHRGVSVITSSGDSLPATVRVGSMAIKTAEGWFVPSSR